MPRPLHRPSGSWLARKRRTASRPWLAVLLPFLLPALILHIAVLLVGDRLLPHLTSARAASAPLRLVILQPPEEEPPPEELLDEPELEEPEGQIVEIPTPDDAPKPPDAEYLADANVMVEEETRTEQFEVNPEVLAPTYSEEHKLEQEDLVDVNVEDPSTGAQVGNERFDPARDGNLSSLPSPYAITNRDGLEAPVPAAHERADASGAPQNDLLNEKLGDQVQLNAKEYLFASYINRIRRLVNFYWKQNVDNLPPSVRFVRSSYTTGVEVILDGNGALEVVEVTLRSTSPELDDAVVQAFRVAGPFPNPPEGIISKDGRIYLPDFTFTVRLGQARMIYDGVDPRAGVQFPGMLKSPR